MKVYLDSVGCRLNQSEIETYARQFRAAGHTLVATPTEADLVVVNTCAVTAAAASDSRQKIRQASRAGVQRIVATGCWASLDPQGALALPGVSRVVPNADKDKLVSRLLHVPPEVFDLEPLERLPVPGARSRTRAFIKVQDGCDNRCTFCITTIARGPGRSQPVKQVLSDIQAALRGGAQEIVLTGVDLGSWGHDFTSPQHLSNLVKTLLAECDLRRLRLSSLEPWDLSDEFFALWQDPRLCPHLHLPLQSGSAATLRRMARKTTPKAFAQLVDAARRDIPGVAITTDVITGFPGEDEAEFTETLAFVERMGFSGGHVFTYSVRLGTTAARMSAQVPVQQRKERNARLRQVFAHSAHGYQQAFVGKTLPVLWEEAVPIGENEWEMSGLSANYLRIFARSRENLWNHITPVHLEEIVENGLLGRLTLHSI
jgi:threonylcarbamoyladenosine tRNA methylthiotransferase MtaB